MRPRLSALAICLTTTAVAGGAWAQTAPGVAQPSAQPAASEPTDVEEVVVTAAPFGVSPDSLTVNTEAVTREDLDVSPPQGLGDLLSGLPGVRSTFFGPGASRPVVRGLQGPRVQVLTNGVGSIDVSAVSPDHAVASDPAEAERIEVLRGPSTILYGGSAIGGVVNVIDARVPTAAPERGVSGRASAQLSSVDDGRAVSGAATVGSGPVVFTVDGLSRRLDDYDTPVGRVANSFVDLDQIGGGASLVGERGYLGAAVRYTDSLYGTVAEEEVTIDLEQTRVDLRGEYRFGPGPFEAARLTGVYADYQHTEFEGEEVGTQFLTEGVEGRLELIQRERGGLSGVVGVSGLDREFQAIGEEAFVPDTDIREVGLFTLQRLDSGRFGVESGLRVDRRELESIDASCDFTSVSATAGVFVRPNPRTYLGLSIARNERAPNEVELFANGPHVATGTFEIGDADFDTERATSVEAAAHYGEGPFTLDLHVFRVAYDGFIDARPTGEVEDDLPVFQYTQTDADFWGVELEASARLWRDGERQVRLEGAYDYVRGDTDLGPPVRIPPYSLTGRLVWESPTLNARLEARHVGEQDRIADFETATDSFTMVNAYAGYTLPQAPGVTLFVEGQNLGDEEAREHASFLKDIAPLPGRNLRAGVAVRF